MGCWNNTCMISNLPIISNEKVKVVILGNKYSTHNRIIGRSGYVYSNDILTPNFLPISGTYNDYGMIENITEDWNYQIITDFLHKKYGSKIKIDNDIKEDWTLEDFLEGIERGCRNIMQYEGYDILEGNAVIKKLALIDKMDLDDDERKKEYKKVSDCIGQPITDELKWIPVDLSWVMIREDIWDACVQLNNKTKFWRTQGSFGSYLNSEWDIFVEYLKLSDDLKKSNDDKVENMKKQMHLTFTMLDNNRLFNTSERQLISKHNYIEYCKQNYENVDLIKDIKVQVLSFNSVSIFIEELRKGWMIQSGQGSQHSGWEEHKALANEIVKICDMKISQWDEENISDEY